jgi:hypothetical protein
MVLAAAVTSALLVVAVGALDAVGAGTSPPSPGESFESQLAQCLRDHGVSVPALRDAQLEPWLKAHEPPLATARACKEALVGVAAPEVKSAGPDDLVRCLRTHGVRPPAPPADLKRWIFAHKGDAAVAQALKECGMGPPPSCGDKDGQHAAPAQGVKDGEA